MIFRKNALLMALTTSALFGMSAAAGADPCNMFKGAVETAVRWSVETRYDDERRQHICREFQRDQDIIWNALRETPSRDKALCFGYAAYIEQEMDVAAARCQNLAAGSPQKERYCQHAEFMQQSAEDLAANCNALVCQGKQDRS